MSKSLIVATALLSTLSFAGYAQESSVCADPIKRVCKDTAGETILRRAKIKSLKDEIAVEANKNAAPRIEEMKKKPREENRESLLMKGKKRRKDFFPSISFSTPMVCKIF